MAEVGIDDSAVVKFFDNDFLFSYFVKNYISANVLPILRKVCVKFNKICKCHWQEIFRKACEPYHWWYGGKNTSDWNGKLWERLYVITTIKNNLLCGTFGGSIESRQAPLKRVDIYGTSKSDTDNENYVFDAIDPSVYTKKEMNTGRQAAASAYNWKLSEIWCVGGFNPNTRNALHSVEIFKTNTFTTHPLPLELKKPRCFSTATFDENNNMIISGGCSSLYQGAKVYSSLEVYSLGSTGSTFDIIPAKMNLLRGGHQSVYDYRRNRLYCLGGYGGGEIYHASMEYVDLSPEVLAIGTSSPFVMCTEMSVKRTGAGADFGPDGAIYVCGGSPDGGLGHKSLERYDPRQGTWEKLSPMTHERGYLAAKFAP